MKYIKSNYLDKLNDNSFVYVNRNILNKTITEYEINKEYVEYTEELKILLTIWNKTYESERKNKRIKLFVKMTNKDIKKCFKNYKKLPLGSFGLVQE